MLTPCKRCGQAEGLAGIDREYNVTVRRFVCVAGHSRSVVEAGDGRPLAIADPRPGLDVPPRPWVVCGGAITVVTAGNQRYHTECEPSASKMQRDRRRAAARR